MLFPIFLKNLYCQTQKQNVFIKLNFKRGWYLKMILEKLPWKFVSFRRRSKISTAQWARYFDLSMYAFIIIIIIIFIRLVKPVASHQLETIWTETLWKYDQNNRWQRFRIKLDLINFFATLNDFAFRVHKKYNY